MRLSPGRFSTRSLIDCKHYPMSDLLAVFLRCVLVDADLGPWTKTRLVCMAVEQDSEVLDEFEPEDFKRQPSTPPSPLRGPMPNHRAMDEKNQSAPWAHGDRHAAHVNRSRSSSPSSRYKTNSRYNIAEKSGVVRDQPGNHRQISMKSGMREQSAKEESYEEDDSKNNSESSVSGSDVEIWYDDPPNASSNKKHSSLSPTMHSSAAKTTAKRKGGAPRRALGAPVRAEDEEEGYTDNRGRDPEWGGGGSTKRKSAGGSGAQTLSWKQKKPTSKGGLISVKGAKEIGSRATNSKGSAPKAKKNRRAAQAEDAEDVQAADARQPLRRGEWFVNKSLSDGSPLAMKSQRQDDASEAQVAVALRDAASTTVRMRAADVEVPMFTLHASLAAEEAHRQQEESSHELTEAHHAHGEAADGRTESSSDGQEDRRGSLDEEAASRQHESALVGRQQQHAASDANGAETEAQAAALPRECGLRVSDTCVDAATADTTATACSDAVGDETEDDDDMHDDELDSLFPSLDMEL
jgi:hypothetical protein